jgi:GH15 family glucan-1,4-alpha-glucosidase
MKEWSKRRPLWNKSGLEFSFTRRGSRLFVLGLSAGILTGGIAFLLLKIFREMLNQPRLFSRAVAYILDGTEKLEDLAFNIASDNLLNGIEKRRLPGGEEKLVLVAGVRNFREPWARDFGFASNGLLSLGQYAATRESLEVFLQMQKPDGQFPIKIHSTTVPHRYLHSFFRREQPIIAPLRPKYFSGHGTISLDGNGLIVIAALNYARQAQDEAFLALHWQSIKKGVDWLQGYAKTRDGLPYQGAFSDWADSINRQGRVLYTNVIYWKALHELAATAPEYGKPGDELELAERANLVRNSIEEYFWRPDLGYYVTSQVFDNLNSSGNLMAVTWDLASPDQAHSILDTMHRYGMADPVPSRPVHRPYPTRYVAFENRLGGIGHYHTQAAWLWLGAWHVIALAKMQRLDEAKELLDRMAKVIVRDGEVHEVYGTDGKFLSNRLYTSEAPLTWSAGMFVYAYKFYRAFVEEAETAKEVRAS